MERGKRVMQPEADFDLNMEPMETDESMEREEEFKKSKKTRIFEIEAQLDYHVGKFSKKETERRNKELKKKVLEYIEENEMPIKTRELEKEKDQNLLWESIMVLKQLISMDLEASSSQSVISDDNKN